MNLEFYRYNFLSGEKKSLKRQATQPKEGYFYTLEATPETIQPVPYVDLV